LAPAGALVDECLTTAAELVVVVLVVGAGLVDGWRTGATVVTGAVGRGVVVVVVVVDRCTVVVVGAVGRCAVVVVAVR
jgi:hypothetical protein